MQILPKGLSEIYHAILNELPLLVQLWVVWISVVFLASIFFVKNHVTARLVLLAFGASIWGALNIWAQVKNVYLLGVSQLIIWTPLVFYIWDVNLSKKGRHYQSGSRMFDIWIRLLFLTIIISLLIALRDIYGVIKGVK